MKPAPSNVESFLGKMTGFDEGHDEFDIFLIPTVPGAKEAKETLQTIYALKSIGVPAEKLKSFLTKWFGMLRLSFQSC